MIDRETLCDLEAEQALCGMVLTEPAAADEALAVLRPGSFYRASHQAIWSAVGALRAKQRGLDVLTVADALQEAGQDAPVPADYLAQLSRVAPSPSMVREYVEMVREAAVRRRMASAAKQVVALAHDPTQAMGALRESITSLAHGALEASAAAEGPVQLSDAVAEAYEHISAIYEGTEKPGINTGVGLIDRWTGGLHRGELTLLGGRPSVGKSSIAQEIATWVASSGRRVYMASAEMPRMLVAMRGLASEAGVDGRRLRGTPRMDGSDWENISRALGVLSNLGARFLVDDRSKTMADVASQARRLHAKEPLALIVVDHLQHLQSPRGVDNRAQAIGSMARECKELAVGLNVAVLALSQLNRQAPGANRRPELHDLRDSGELEQMADVVMLLHRADDPPPPLCRVECAVAKNRNGELVSFALHHHRPTGRWYDNPQQVREERGTA